MNELKLKVKEFFEENGDEFVAVVILGGLTAGVGVGLYKAGLWRGRAEGFRTATISLAEIQKDKIAEKVVEQLAE